MSETINRIEISFALPVELTDAEYKAIYDIVDRACRRSCPEGWTHWPAEYGDRPNWSLTDCAVLGLEPTPDSPASGEPTFDASVFCITCAARELSPKEIESNRKRGKS